MSCKTPDKDPFSCEGHICVNGGYCNLGTCLCPTGYQDATCSTAWNSKFAGNWSLSESVVGSDSTKSIGRSATYTIQIDTAHSVTSVVMSNFENNSYYSNVIAVVDSSATFNTLAIQKFTPTNNGNAHIQGGNLVIDAAMATMTGFYYTNYRNDNGYVQNDTLSITLTRQ
jgi:hypothetical protein